MNYKADGTPFWNQFFVAALRDDTGKVFIDEMRFLFFVRASYSNILGLAAGCRLCARRS